MGFYTGFADGEIFRDGEMFLQDYEPSSLQGMVASFERHLKRKSYSVSIINDLAFDRLRKTLHFNH